MTLGSFYIFRKEVFTKMHQRIGKNTCMRVIDSLEAVDIDTAEDFAFAEVVAKYLGLGG